LADLERGIISKVVFAHDILPALEARITSDFFASPEHRRVWEYLVEYFNRYGETATLKAVKSNFPTYKVLAVEEPFGFYIDALRDRRRFTLSQEGLGTAIEALSNDELDPGEAAAQALVAVATMLTKVGTEVSVLRDTNTVETHEARMQRYRSYKDLPGGMRGLPCGIRTLDNATSGFQKQQLITLVGEPKAGKSTFLLSFALAAHLYGATPLFIGFEMSNEEQEARMDAMIGKLNYTKLLQGRLTTKELDRLADALEARKNLHPFILSSDISSATTVSGLHAKVKQYKPTIVYIDGTYLMDDELGQERGTPQALTNITRGLKRLGQVEDIPVVNTTQVLTWKLSRRKGITGDSIGYTSSFAQDSDLILGVEHIEDMPNMVKLKTVLGRNVGRVEVKVTWDWETTTFEEVGGFTEEDEENEIVADYDYESMLDD
jgi:replicative DNA helicase